jgi:hypothetical protein
MEKINVAELLKDCPKGMELDCTILNDVTLDSVDEKDIYPIIITTKSGLLTSLTKYGQHIDIEDAKCIIFPKGKTTWEGFQRTFKDGNVVVTTLNNIAIIKEPIENGYSAHVVLLNNTLLHTAIVKVCVARLATEEEKQKLFDAIKDNGYKWNSETKTLDELVKPEFKVGDRVKRKDVNYTFIVTIVDIDREYYGYVNKNGEYSNISIKSQDNWELVTDKFDITTLKPFDKVLVRDCNKAKWNIDFFAYYRDSNDYQCMTFTKNQCIPYEGNEHLLGKTRDCDNFYKTWEK